MDAVPIVPPLFRDTKNTTLHELQTGDSSRATDTNLMERCQFDRSVRRWDRRLLLPKLPLHAGNSFPTTVGHRACRRRRNRLEHGAVLHAAASPWFLDHPVLA